MLTDEEICLQIQSSFEPYLCVAEIWDYGKKLRLRVFDNQNKPLKTIENIELNSIRNTVDIESLCNNIRLRIDYI